MTDLQTVTAQQRYDYEKRFAAAVSIAPDFARQEVGWLEPEQILSIPVASFWGGILEGEDTVRAATRAGREFYRELTNYIAAEPGPENLRAYAAEIAKWDYLSRVSKGLSGVAQDVGKGDADAVRERLKAMADEKAAGHVVSTDASVGLEEFSEGLDNLAGRSISTGIPPLDAATGGLEIETLTIFAARTGMGKTALAWQLARNAAQMRERALYVTLEMSQKALYARAVCGLVGVRWKDVRAGRVEQADIERLKIAAKNLRDKYSGMLFVNDRSNTTSTVWNEVSSLRPSLVVVDHLRWLRDTGESERIRLGRMSARLKEMSKEFDCAVLCLHQLNRGLTQREDKRPNLSDLRESGELEENADNVWFLHRDDYFDNSLSHYGDMSRSEIILAKFRDDKSNQKVNVDFHLGAQWFTRVGEQPEV